MLLTERMGNQVEPHLRSVNRHLAVQAAMLIVMVATGDLVAVLLDLVLMIAGQLAVWTAPMVVLLIQCPVVKGRVPPQENLAKRTANYTPLGVMDTRVLPRQEMQIQGMVATAMATEKTKMVLVVLESQSSAMQGGLHNGKEYGTYQKRHYNQHAMVFRF